MALPWFDVQAAETKVGAGDGQTLNDKYRQNFDKMGSPIIGDGHSHDGSVTGEGPPIPAEGIQNPYKIYNSSLNQAALTGDIVIAGPTPDFRDKMIEFNGLLMVSSIANITADIVVGGANDNLIGGQQTPANPRYIRINPFTGGDSWFYSSAGGANRTTQPFWTAQDETTSLATLNIWVDIATGELKLGWNLNGAIAAGSRSLGWFLRVQSSKDLGGH